ncbi:MAG: response regulator transcription factor [Planctomycetota bacterium]|jgi:FixJ family two-component response regulator
MVRQVFYAEGEKGSTDVIRAALRQLDLRVKQFGNVEQCLACLGTQECHLLISDARRPAEEGLRLLAGARRIKPSVPVVLLVDRGDIQTAVCAMKGQAADCLERPPESARLVSAIGSVLKNSDRGSLPPDHLLSKTEKTVLQLILEGNTTAEVARMLSRSRRTVEVHRSHIMEKLEARDVVDLVRTCFRMGLLEDWP